MAEQVRQAGRAAQYRGPHRVLVSSARVSSGRPRALPSRRLPMNITAYIIKRVLLAIPTILGVTILTFFMIHLVPGDPAGASSGPARHPSSPRSFTTSGVWTSRS